MQIERAKEIGFCFGVKRAVDLLEKAAQQYGRLETLGAVVHNRTVMDDLAARGIDVIETLEGATGKVVAISSHGVGPKLLDDLKARDLTVIDATCPRVRHAQRIAREMSDLGFSVVVYGEAEHPEVRGILGWAAGKGVASIDAQAVQFSGAQPSKVGILAQTTRSHTGFSSFVTEYVRRWLPKGSELRVVNTICQATSKRQAAALELTKRDDLMIVVGGRSSSNTKRLAETCQAAGVETHLIEHASEVQRSWLVGRRAVGVTAGTSTPDKAIDEVVARLRELGATLPRL